MAAIVHLTDAARAGLAILLVFTFLLLIFAAVAWIVEEYSPERDEDEELGDYPRLRRLPL